MREGFENTQVTRRKILISLIGSVPLATVSVGGATAAAKVAQSIAQYQPTPKGGQACAGCNSFTAPNHCKLVAGDISPSGWCRLWTKNEG
jgi:hypothetical protein